MACASRILQSFCLALILGAPAAAQIQPGRHQTDTVTPIVLDTNLPYQITLQEYDFGASELPTLHSYAAGHYDGKWVLLAGRTNGLHGFDPQNPENNFPTEFQNREVWVIDPVNKQSWSRSLSDFPGTLTEFQINALTPTNNQFLQRGDELYMTGGYGVQSGDGNGNETFGTFDTLSAINLPGIVDWVQTGSGQSSDHIRIIQDSTVKVTGGAMYEINGRTHLVFGQDFDGVYSPALEGAYTNQVRSFDIVDDGVNLSISNLSSSTPDDDYRRRDLNVFPVLSDDGGPQLEQGIVVLSGVFTTTFGAWTVPVEIDANGNPTMADPDDPDTFKQGFNGYHSAKVGLFSESTGEMHEVLFGGISLQYLDRDTDEILADNRLPFINDITAVTIDSNGTYSQHHLGHFPEILDAEDNRLRFGANAEFFAADGIQQLENGVLDLDAISGETTLGYVFGGIVANGPHTRQGNATSSATDLIFEVVLTPIIPGDYNRDGMVDSADYGEWKSLLGSTSELRADGNRNGVVDAADYLVWLENLGATSGSGNGSSTSPTPEPSALCLVILTALAGIFFRSSRDR